MLAIGDLAGEPPNPIGDRDLESPPPVRRQLEFCIGDVHAIEANRLHEPSWRQRDPAETFLPVTSCMENVPSAASLPNPAESGSQADSFVGPWTSGSPPDRTEVVGHPREPLVHRSTPVVRRPVKIGDVVEHGQVAIGVVPAAHVGRVEDRQHVVRGGHIGEAESSICRDRRFQIFGCSDRHEGNGRCGQ